MFSEFFDDKLFFFIQSKIISEQIVSYTSAGKIRFKIYSKPNSCKINIILQNKTLKKMEFRLQFCYCLLNSTPKNEHIGYDREIFLDPFEYKQVSFAVTTPAKTGNYSGYFKILFDGIDEIIKDVKFISSNYTMIDHFTVFTHRLMIKKYVPNSLFLELRPTTTPKLNSIIKKKKYLVEKKKIKTDDEFSLDEDLEKIDLFANEKLVFDDEQSFEEIFEENCQKYGVVISPHPEENDEEINFFI